jgi:predicted alpha/beta-hydrolase family hydrolase
MRLCFSSTQQASLVALGMALGGCTLATPTPEVAVEELTFVTEDGVSLAGTLYLPPEADIALVLAHQGTAGTDQRSWQPFAELTAQRGFATLTFDFRGRGQSEGLLDVRFLRRDVVAAIDVLRQRGFERIVCMGASMGGTACLTAALDTDLEGLVVIASGMSLVAPTRVGAEDLAGLTMPKLFVCTEDDTADGNVTGVAVVMEGMYEHSPEPKAIRIFPGTAHGTEPFDTEHGEELRELLLAFLEGLR